jgi:zona occludens toxin (predicted ATPase)
MNMMTGSGQSDPTVLKLWLGADLPVFIESDDAVQAATATPFVVLKKAPVGIGPAATAPIAATFDVGALTTQDGMTGWPASLNRAAQSDLEAGTTYAGQVLIELSGGAGFYTELFWIKVHAPLMVRS